MFGVFDGVCFLKTPVGLAVRRFTSQHGVVSVIVQCSKRLDVFASAGCITDSGVGVRARVHECSASSVAGINSVSVTACTHAPTPTASAADVAATIVDNAIVHAVVGYLWWSW